ncbi:ABC transporter substrate-binding protein [Bacillus gobiensis]|uniref:ABC transporter substrate-binding protein n=1 Tax=Bacillus gobiensis TaxID=1441095 RepID=UPI003D1F0308
MNIQKRKTTLKKLYLFLSLIFITSIFLSGCEQQKAHKSADGKYETTELRYYSSPGAVSYPELAEDLGYLGPIKLKNVGIPPSGGPQEIQNVVTEDVDFGSAFNGAIIKLIAAKAPIKSVIGTYGIDKDSWVGLMVLDNSPIKNAKDLIGKKVALNTLGAHGEYMLKEYLQQNGLSKKEISSITLVPVPLGNIEMALRHKQVDAALFGGIFRDKAIQRGGIHPLVTDYDIFGNFTAGSYVMNKNFLKQNPNTSKKFIEGTAKAIEWAQTTPRDQVVDRFIKIVKKRDGANIDTSGINLWKSTGISGKGGLLKDKEFNIWIDQLVKSGTLKNEQLSPQDVYTNDYNPYKNQ